MDISQVLSIIADVSVRRLHTLRIQNPNYNALIARYSDSNILFKQYSESQRFDPWAYFNLPRSALTSYLSRFTFRHL